MGKPQNSLSAFNSPLQNLLAAACGVFLALCLVKFGNPVIFEQKISTPHDMLEFLYAAWPIQWGHIFIGLLIILAVPVARWQKRPAPAWLLLSLLIWLGWQFISATQSVDHDLSSLTVRHFMASVACFGIGYFALSEVRDRRLLWFGLMIGFLIVIKSGFEQHFGGLERSREYFKIYIAPQMTDIPADYLKKINSNRIFSTLFYPNSLAAAVLFALPITAAFVWSMTAKPLLKWPILIGIIVGGLACLGWSGSKAGWLLALVSGTVLLIHLPLSARYKTIILLGVGVLGLVGFGLKYAGFFQRGATSVVARTDYWRAAVKIAVDHPFVGTGPGTFMVPYAKLKAPEAEMARLCHNDYLQQASDSGLVGFIAFFLGIWGGLAWLYRERTTKYQVDSVFLMVWLGLLGLALHSFVEFHFYIAGLAWPFFLLFGLLCGDSRNQIDKPTVRA